MRSTYNKARNFINDCLDAHILACALKYFCIDSADWEPKENAPLEIQNEDKLKYLEKCAKEILEIIFHRPVVNHAAEIQHIEGQEQSLQVKGNDEKIKCPFGGCNKTYKQEGWLKAHLRKVHDVTLSLVPPQHTEPESEVDGIFNYAAAFVKVALLYRDMHDAYSMGDGNRVFRNLKFILLHVDKGHHLKYRLWSFRMLAYDLCLLSEYEKQCYRNNIAINISGGTRQCIANDNLVEIHVKKVKECITAMGANYSVNASRRAAKCINVTRGITDSLATTRSGRHSTPKTDQDVRKMAYTLSEYAVFQRQPGRSHVTYPNMASDLLENTNLVTINNWLTANKKRAKTEMQLTT